MDALVVDDSRTIRIILSQMLGSCGIESVAQAADGAAALAALDARPSTGLMLADWNMPGMSGFDLLQRVRARPEFAQLRIVMVTTEADVAHMQQAVTAGADEYITKPFTRDAVVEKLRLLGIALRES